MRLGDEVDGAKPYVPEINQDDLSKLIAIMGNAFKDDKEKLLPVYDAVGNLLWPKQMNYEEVKNFVEERDKKETEE